MKYIACLKNKQILWRNFKRDDLAVARFKKLAIQYYSQVTDLCAIENGQLRRLSWK